jgi:fused signal recognition particle receptor
VSNAEAKDRGRGEPDLVPGAAAAASRGGGGAADQSEVGWLGRLKAGLSRTSSRLGEGIASLVAKRRLDPETLEELEELLIKADLGVETAARVSHALARERFDKNISDEAVREILAREVCRVLEPVARPLSLSPANKPHVILVVGVNGSGKTTTIGKLAAQFAREGRKVVLAAGDTFRAAAIDQLKAWGERTGSRVIAHEVGSDASALLFDALKAAREENADVLIGDTAGRLQNKDDLMAELEKIVRVLRKLDPTAPHDVLLVLDATTGQNAITQVEIFRKRAGVSGLIMTKLDGTARGGILVPLALTYGLPVHAIGIGEGTDDLQRLDAREFSRALVGA